MGLDQFAYKMKFTPSKEVDFSLEIAEMEKEGDDRISRTSIYTWRKHPNLQGWMEELYYEKGGESDCFNCVPVLLTETDLKKLRDTIMADALPETSGFFFGESNGLERDEDLEFVEKALFEISEGYTVYYSSWW